MILKGLGAFQDSAGNWYAQVPGLGNVMFDSEAAADAQDLSHSVGGAYVASSGVAPVYAFAEMVGGGTGGRPGLVSSEEKTAIALEPLPEFVLPGPLQPFAPGSEYLYSARPAIKIDLAEGPYDQFGNLISQIGAQVIQPLPMQVSPSPSAPISAVGGFSIPKLPPMAWLAVGLGAFLLLRR